MGQRIGIGLAAVCLSMGTGAFAATPTALDCTVVGGWACSGDDACTPIKQSGAERYSFDLVAMTYRAPSDSGAITDFELNDKGFMSFEIGGDRLYVHKHEGEVEPITSFLYLSPKDMRQLRCDTRNDAKAVADHQRKLVGHYYLSGVMETGSEMLLRPDGSFAWFMSYGAVDQIAEGKWRVDNAMVVLEAEPNARVQPPFRQMRLRIDGGALLPEGAEGRYQRHP